MLSNFYKPAFRSLLKNKLYSLLNILGLAIGMAGVFFILQYVHFERSYESYNKYANSVYRVPLQYRENAGKEYTKATNHPAAGPALKANFPEVIAFTRLIPANSLLATATISRIEGGSVKISKNENRVFFADANVLKFFSVPLIYGNDSIALRQMRAIVLSASEAKKYFGAENPLNKTLFLNGSFPLTVSGVFKDIPENSHLKFDMLISFPDEKFHADNWKWSEFYTYITLAPGVNPDSLESKFPPFIDRYLGLEMKRHNVKNRFYLQPIKDIHLSSHYRNELSDESRGGNFCQL